MCAPYRWRRKPILKGPSTGRSRLCLAAVIATAPAGAHAAGVDLAALDVNTGAALNGAAGLDLSGHSVAPAGDLNGDGIADLLISALNAAPNGAGSGACYVVFGTSGGVPAVVELSALDGSNGLVLNGAIAGDFAGISVAAAGDVNADGFDDIIVGAYAADPNGASSGRSYVLYGTDQAFPATVELAMLNGTDGFVLNGATAVERSGRSVAGAGDVNGDGIDDLVIGALNAAANGVSSGKAYVVFGTAAGFPAAFELSSLDGSTGFVLSGANADDHAGVSVSSAGDINADGFGDVIIGAATADPAGIVTGAAYVVFGSDVPFPPVLGLGSLDGTSGFAIHGAMLQDNTGLSVAGLGDVNADGIDDVIVGVARLDINGTDAGGAYVIFGSEEAFPPVVDPASLNGVNGFVIVGAAPGDQAGTSVSSAGDFNGDGVDDLLIGAHMANQGGAAWVIFGQSDGVFANMVSLGDLDPSAGFAVNGAAAGNDTGQSVAAAGDVNDDGIEDIVIGAPGADPNGRLSGTSYVVYGQDADCNGNDVLDMLDLACGSSTDLNFNNRPDECDADIDGDGVVTIADMLALLAAWGDCPDPPAPCPADLDGDGSVGIVDFLILLASWG